MPITSVFLTHTDLSLLSFYHWAPTSDTFMAWKHARGTFIIFFRSLLNFLPFCWFLGHAQHSLFTLFVFLLPSFDAVHPSKWDIIFNPSPLWTHKETWLLNIYYLWAYMCTCTHTHTEEILDGILIDSQMILPFANKPWSTLGRRGWEGVDVRYATSARE